MALVLVSAVLTGIAFLLVGGAVPAVLAILLIAPIVAAIVELQR